MKYVLLTLINFFLICSVSAQIEATTKEGKKIILNNDGTWKYAPEEKKVEVSFVCADIIVDNVDKVTGNTTRRSKEAIIVSEDGKNGFALFVVQGQGNTVILMMTVVGGGSSCIDDDSKMNVLFRDGTRVEIINNGKFNCEGEFTVYFGGSFGKKKELQEFKTKEVETMRVWTSKSYVEKDFTSDNSKLLLKSFECL